MAIKPPKPRNPVITTLAELNPKQGAMKTKHKVLPRKAKHKGNHKDVIK